LDKKTTKETPSSIKGIDEDISCRKGVEGGFRIWGRYAWGEKDVRERKGHLDTNVFSLNPDGPAEKLFKWGWVG